MSEIIRKIKIQHRIIRKEISSKIKEFKKTHPRRFYSTVLLLLFIGFTLFYKFVLFKDTFSNMGDVSDAYDFKTYDEIHIESIEEAISKAQDSDVYGRFKKSNQKVRTDVGFVDLRVLTLEEFFTFYKSPLVDYADEFIEACERYEVENWQLIPAIAINETGGCRTDISDIQKNCWGWGGAFPNRWIFFSYDDAIDTITSRMISSYGNERMNSKDIQSTYCGANCMASGWKWAKGVQGYVVQINDMGEKYNLPRTNEDIDWTQT